MLARGAASLPCCKGHIVRVQLYKACDAIVELITGFVQSVVKEQWCMKNVFDKCDGKM
jgi:hypothetical protein